MSIKINAAARLKAGWWDDLSSMAKKAYKKLHPNSKMGDANSSPSNKDSKSGSSEALHKAQEEHKQNMKNYDKHRDSMHDNSTDAEWAAHDRALRRLEKSRDRLAKLK